MGRDNTGITPPPEDPPRPRATSGATEKRSVAKRLKGFFVSFGEASRYAWLPALIVSSVSAYYAFQNYNSDRPQIIFNKMDITDPYDDGILSLRMINVGSRTAFDYKVDIITVDLKSGLKIDLNSANASNPIAREGGVSAQPKLDMKKYLDVLVLCSTYHDDRETTFSDLTTVQFPNMTRGLTKDKGGGGVYLAAGVSPDDRKKREKMAICKD